jgi:predicted DNA binding CopG/RHH family protein
MYLPEDGDTEQEGYTELSRRCEMNRTKLDETEKQVLRDYDADEFKSVLTPARRKLIQKIAQHSVRKDKRINIRLSGRDLAALQRRALEEGIPYQTLVSSVLHKYVSGGLQDIVPFKERVRNQ